MSTTVDPAAEAPGEHVLDDDPEAVHPHAHDGHPSGSHSDAFYIKIAVILALMTSLEVSTYYIDFGVLFMPTLLIIMAIKFFMVAWFFMHLRDDAKLFGRVFWAGLFLAVFVYAAALATFKFFLA